MAAGFNDTINYIKAQARYYYLEGRNIYLDAQNKFGIEVGLKDDYTFLLQQHWDANEMDKISEFVTPQPLYMPFAELPMTLPMRPI